MVRRLIQESVSTELTEFPQATFMPPPPRDSATRLHNQLMRGQDLSRTFFPSEVDRTSGPQPSDLSRSTSSIPESSAGAISRARKLSNKLTKKRPSLKSDSTPPTSFRAQGPAVPDEQFLNAVVSNVDMIVAKSYDQRKAPKTSERFLAERSFASASAPEAARATPSPVVGQRSRTESDTESYGGRPPALKRASSSVELGLTREIPLDPFSRAPPTIVERGPSATSQAKNGFGRAALRDAEEPLKRWNPPKADQRGTIIALYQPPAPQPGLERTESPRGGPRQRSNTMADPERDDTIIALYQPPPAQARIERSLTTRDPPRPAPHRNNSLPNAENDDTIIALYKPPPPPQQPLPTPRDTPRQRSNTLGSSALPPDASRIRPPPLVRSQTQTERQQVPRTASDPRSIPSASSSTSNPPSRNRSNTEGPVRNIDTQFTPQNVPSSSKPSSPTQSPRPLRSAMKRPVAPPPLAVGSAPTGPMPAIPLAASVAPPSRPPRSQLRADQSQPQVTRQFEDMSLDRDRPVTRSNTSSSTDSDAAPATPLEVEETPFGPVPIFDPDDRITVAPLRVRKRSEAAVAATANLPKFSTTVTAPVQPTSSRSPSKPSSPVAGVARVAASPTITTPSPSSPSSDRGRPDIGTPASPGDMSGIGNSFLNFSSEPTTPASPMFGGRASDIRNRILNERGGRA